MHFKWKHKLCLRFFQILGKIKEGFFFNISLFIFCSHFFQAKSVCLHPIRKVCLIALLLHTLLFRIILNTVMPEGQKFWGCR